MAEETLNRTRVGVTRASRSEQVPWISSSLAEDFSFIPGQRTQAPPPVVPPIATAKPPAPAPVPPVREEATKSPPPLAPPPLAQPPKQDVAEPPASGTQDDEKGVRALAGHPASNELTDPLASKP